MAKQLIKTQQKEKDKRLFFILLIGVSILLVIGAILVAVLVPLISKLPKKVSRTYEVTTEVLQDSSKYDYSEHVLTILGDEEEMTFSSNNPNTAIGTDPLYSFIFANPDDDISEADIFFYVESHEINSISFTITCCDNHGENEKVLLKEEYSEEKISEHEYRVHIDYDVSLYIKKVSLTYTYLI